MLCYAMQAAAEQAEAGCRGQLDDVEAQIAELEAHLALGDMAAAAGAAGGGGNGAGAGEPAGKALAVTWPLLGKLS